MIGTSRSSSGTEIGCLALTKISESKNFTHASPLCFCKLESCIRARVCTGKSTLAMPGMASSNTELPLSSCIGFNGSVDGGLVLEKDGTTVIYPLGSTIIVKQLHKDQQQMFLQGHTDEVIFSRSFSSL